jgi:hypothetical protein
MPALNWNQQLDESFEYPSDFDFEKSVEPNKKKEKKKKILNKTYRKCITNPKTELDQLPMIRESTELHDGLSSEGQKYSILKPCLISSTSKSFTLPRLAPSDKQFTETSKAYSFIQESLPEISFKRFSTYIPSIHIENEYENQYQNYNKFICNFRDKFSAADKQKDIDTINIPRQFRLQPLERKLSSRPDSKRHHSVRNVSNKNQKLS